MYYNCATLNQTIDTECIMSTTTIRLSGDLKARISLAAKRAGTTAHSFIIEAITEKTAQEEKRTSFVAEAEERYSNVIVTGKTIPWPEMQDYLKKRVAGQNAMQPSARKLDR